MSSLYKGGVGPTVNFWSSPMHEDVQNPQMGQVSIWVIIRPEKNTRVPARWYRDPSMNSQCFPWFLHQIMINKLHNNKKISENLIFSVCKYDFGTSRFQIREEFQQILFPSCFCLKNLRFQRKLIGDAGTRPEITYPTRVHIKYPYSPRPNHNPPPNVYKKFE